MKKGLLTCVIISIIAWSPQCVRKEKTRASAPTFIRGKISPAEAAEAVLIMDAKDTLTTSIVDGNFLMQVKPDIYKLVVSAKPPYSNASLGNIEVKQYRALDIGEIILQHRAEK
jgi:hypothetical protein